VPTAYGFQDVVMKGFVDAGVIMCGSAEIARHSRCYGEGVFVSNPLYYRNPPLRATVRLL
jgi:hypothetical protein